MTIISLLVARLAKLEAQRRSPTPDPRRLAEVTERLVAWVDALRDPEDLRAAQAQIAAARRQAGAR